MRREMEGRVVGFGLIGLIGVAGLPAARADAMDEICLRKAQSAVDSIIAADYVAAERDFAPKIAAAFPPERLRQAVEGPLARSLGALRSAGAGRAQTGGDGTGAFVPVVFEHGPMVAFARCDPQGAITAFTFQPANDPVGSSWAAPPYADAHRYHELPLAVGAAPALGATLSLPDGEGPFPVVVLVHGSGTHDRDETLGPTKVFADLAAGLASRGIAVLRYDKRGYAHPPTPLEATSVTLETEVIDDAVAAVELLRQSPWPSLDPKRIYVLGHSLGAELAPRIAMKSGRVAGLVLMAAPAAPLADTILRQRRYLLSLKGPLDDDGRSQLAATEAEVAQLRRLSAGEPVTGPLPFNAPPDYLREWAAVDAIADARKAAAPMLVLQGLADYKVSPVEDFRRWQAAFGKDRRVRLLTYPGLSHRFMAADDAGSQQPLHVEAKVVEDIADWIAPRAD